MDILRRINLPGWQRQHDADPPPASFFAPRVLRLGVGHVVIWVLFEVIAAVMAVQVCLGYNRIAGTDKTPWHIAQIALGMSSGPLVGPIANPGAGDVWAWNAFNMTVALAVMLAISLLPFVVSTGRRPFWVHVIAWGVFLMATCCWYFGALVSLAMFLS